MKDKILEQADNIDEEFENIRRSFLDASVERLDNLEVMLVGLEKKGDFSPESFRPIFSLVHSLKGASAAHEFNLLKTACHRIEDNLQSLKNGTFPRQNKILDQSLRLVEIMLDFVKKYLKDPGPKIESSFQRKIENLYQNSTSEKTRILILANTKTVNNILEKSLKECNVEIHYARTAFEGLGRIYLEKFDCVICSMHTPMMDARALTAAIRLDTSVEKMKIVILTSDELDFSHTEYKPDFIFKKNPQLGDNIKEFIRCYFGNEKWKQTA